jgi:hypothetical protein
MGAGRVWHRRNDDNKIVTPLPRPKGGEVRSLGKIFGSGIYRSHLKICK